MSVSPEFAPIEPAFLIRLEHSYFVEAAFETIFYGMTVTLYILTVANLYTKRRLKSSWPLLLFLTTQQVAVLTGVMGNIDLLARAFVYNRNIPGGPSAYQFEYSNLPFSFAALAGFTIATWLQDAFLLYRAAVVIWNGYCLAMFIFPFLIYLAAIAFSLILLVQTGQHAGLIASLQSIPVPLVFFSLSSGMNIILTLLIGARLAYYRHKLVASGVGPTRARQCVPRYTMLVESAVLYSAVGLAQVVSLHTDPAVATGIEGLYGVMTAFAPHLIAYRISTDSAWSRDKMHKLMLEHTPHSYSASQSGDVEQQQSDGHDGSGDEKSVTKVGHVVRKV